VDGDEIALHVRPLANGFLLSFRGAREKAYVYTEREAALARLMPARTAADAGKFVRSPMPGLVLSLTVAAGQEVKTGDTLAVVEAMKMENVLRAERDGKVRAVHVKPGDSVAVDAAIVEFE
jgi:propionyl-CoA carboxylase alpha chain